MYISITPTRIPQPVSQLSRPLNSDTMPSGYKLCFFAVKNVLLKLFEHVHTYCKCISLNYIAEYVHELNDVLQRLDCDIKEAVMSKL